MTMQPPSAGCVRGTDLGAVDSDRSRRAGERFDVSPGELLELLGDEYTRRVLQAIAARSMSAREVAEHTGFSKVTAYRRLDRLEGAGLVESTTVLDPDGHHYAQYRPVFDRVSFRFADDDIEFTTPGEEPDATERPDGTDGNDSAGRPVDGA